MKLQPVIDQLSRPIKDLRISLTDRCQFRCQYCLPAEHVAVMRQQAAATSHLSYPEITAVVEAFALCGVEKIRLTGGEPLLRKNVALLIKNIKAIAGIKEVALTTNGALLNPVLADLITAGLDRITISLDAVEQALFAEITGTEYQVKDIIDTIIRSSRSALSKVKVNCVVRKGCNENQIIPMLELFRGTAVEVRFIEFMDVGNINGWQPAKVYSSKLALTEIAKQWPFTAEISKHKGEVANRFSFNDGQGSFGVISSISQPFCSDCNRARLSSQGEIFTCLFSNQGHNIKAIIDKPALLNHKISEIWQQRNDQYSMNRVKQQGKKTAKIEMFVMGG